MKLNNKQKNIIEILSTLYIVFIIISFFIITNPFIIEDKIIFGILIKQEFFKTLAKIYLFMTTILPYLVMYIYFVIEEYIHNKK